ncbi:MAG TPA: glycosyltransferase [Gemmataceae bacterium]|jgi:glycosyltransferase involved in cell wall biosynthesis|nr:glycosyltransferase [Gemmataceae bacterium]
MPSRPKVLWVPHTSWEHCLAQRPRLLVDALRDRFDLHVVTWETSPLESRSRSRFYLNPANHLRALRTHSRTEDGVTVHHASVPLPVLQRFAHGYPAGWVLVPAQRMFQRSLRRFHRRERFDAAVVSASHHFTGYPPRLPGVPVVFDYVDTSPPEVEAAYLREADRIVSVSHYLADRVRETYGRDARVIPNGVHLDRLRRADPARARAKWSLAGKRVVSLIGLTCSSRLYFVDALARLVPEFPDLVLVAAGGGRLVEAIRSKCAALGVPAVLTGWVDPAEVPDLFAATDVGLYPGDDTPYFDGACPLKVLEYTAVRVPVVVNRGAELIRLGFPSLVIRPATAEAFEDGLRQVLTSPPTSFPDMASYDWQNLAAEFGDEIDAVLAAAPAPVEPR